MNNLYLNSRISKKIVKKLLININSEAITFNNYFEIVSNFLENQHVM